MALFFPSLYGQSDITCFTIVISLLDEYYWKLHIKFKLETSKFEVDM